MFRAKDLKPRSWVIRLRSPKIKVWWKVHCSWSPEPSHLTDEKTESRERPQMIGVLTSAILEVVALVYEILMCGEGAEVGKGWWGVEK